MFSLSEDPAKVLSPGKEVSFCARIILNITSPGLQVSDWPGHDTANWCQVPGTETGPADTPGGYSRENLITK